MMTMAGVDGGGSGVQASSVQASAVQDSGGGHAQDSQADEGLDTERRAQLAQSWHTPLETGHGKALLHLSGRTTPCSLTLKKAIANGLVLGFGGLARCVLDVELDSTDN